MYDVARLDTYVGATELLLHRDAIGCLARHTARAREWIGTTYCPAQRHAVDLDRDMLAGREIRHRPDWTATTVLADLRKRLSVV
jgi:hypothetical protein